MVSRSNVMAESQREDDWQDSRGTSTRRAYRGAITRASLHWFQCEWTATLMKRLRYVRGGGRRSRKPYSESLLGSQTIETLSTAGTGFGPKARDAGFLSGIGVCALAARAITFGFARFGAALPKQPPNGYLMLLIILPGPGLGYAASQQ
jgi:hypothetical protein